MRVLGVVVLGVLAGKSHVVEVLKQSQGTSFKGLMVFIRWHLRHLQGELGEVPPHVRDRIA